MSGLLRVAKLAGAGLLLAAQLVTAQAKLGEFSTNLSGTIAPGYTATYGNLTSSTHSWTVGGAANLSGYFHSPNFLSYNSSLYLNQSRANSNFQSISNASGVSVSANIFGGSPFPGSVNYSKAFNSDGNYAVPGLANYVTHGNSDTFGINWNENLPDAPSFSAGFQMGNSQYSVYGTNDQGRNAFHSLNLHSAYKLEGFNMGAYYSLGSSRSLIPQVVAGQQDATTNSDNDAYGVNVTHILPLKGSVSAGVNRSDWNSDYLGSSFKGSIDLLNALAAVHPTDKVSFTASANYSDNLTGQLLQSVIVAGAAVPGLNQNESSNSLDLLGVGTYSPLPALQTSAFVERRTQLFEGETYGVKSYGGGITYAHELLDGSFNTALTVTDNNADKTGENALGFSTTENYSSVLLGWHVNGSFSYAQNVQTLLITYMNSFYNYSGSIRRNWGQLNMSAGGGAARTGLTEAPGTANTSQSYNASLGYTPWITATASYSKSSGQALATGAGLVPITVPSPTLPSNLVTLFGGDSYSASVSSTPIKKFIFAAAYAKSIGNTTSSTSTGPLASANQNEQFNTLIQYQTRKLNFTSGYARLEQGFSASGTAPEVISSFFIGVSRWFNVF